ncbi:MAG: YfhO family protein [Anaerolineae bacterium]|nr:YfhO family protein [Anaerolineae bacterium]MDW8099824.1 YfhO family protein [Anaerolineae bacterium]
MLRESRAQRPVRLLRDPRVEPVLIALALLALSVWAFRHTVLTNKVLARGDTFTYFTPYWAYRAEALRAGRLPLWNPYLFLGVPFLANPQAAVLYPLHWPLIWLRPERALIWSLVLHIWLAACFTYALARHWRVGRIGALAAAIGYAMGGHLMGHTGQVNQVNVLAWFPLALLLLDRTISSSSSWPRLDALTGLSCVLALQLLAGHTQATYISTAGLGMYIIAGPLWEAIQQRLGVRLLIRRLVAWLGALALAVMLALAIAAMQILPTLELTRLSIRSGGLGYLETVAFSLKPHQLLLALLPPYAMAPEAAFNTPAFAEYLAYLGISGLMLAVLGVTSPLSPHRPLRMPMMTLATGGLLLALGGYTPLYFVLYKAIPGFDLFRVPPRWLAWYALAMAVLAGLGLDRLVTPGELSLRAKALAAWSRVVTCRWRQAVVGATALLAAALLLLQHWPSWNTIAAWTGLVILTATLIALGQWSARLRLWIGLLLLAVLYGELLIAAWPLDLNHPSAPEAVTSLRTAPTHLLASPGRFLSMSSIRFDPGDLSEMHQLLGDQLDEAGFRDYVTAAKLKEIIAPNLSMGLHLPSIDGYDGGVLPLARYTWFQTLFITPDRLLPDGRLREQLQEIPASRMLDLAGVRYVITDKVRDVWVDGVYYDLQGRVALTPGQSFTLRNLPSFSATAIGLISYLESPFPPAGAQAGEVEVIGQDGEMVRLDVLVERDTAPGTALRPQVRVAYHDDLWGVNYYQATLSLPRPMRPEALTFRSTLPAGNWVVRGVTLVDGRTGQFVALVASPDGRLRRVHSGDVKVYELEGALGRAFVIGRARVIPDDEAAIAALADWSFDPRQEVILSAGKPLWGPAAVGSAHIVIDQPEMVVIEASLTAPGYLVLTDAEYPGWQAMVDGRPAPIFRANFLFRAVALTPGKHQVVFLYRPEVVRRGAWLSLMGLGVAMGLSGVGFWASRRGKGGV